VAHAADLFELYSTGFWPLNLGVTRRFVSMTLSGDILLIKSSIMGHPMATLGPQAPGPRLPHVKSRGGPRSERGTRGNETSADAPRELEPGSGELRRKTKKLAAVSPFRIGRSRGRPLESPDKLAAVDRPAAESQTRDRVNGLAVDEGACVLPETGGGHSVGSWMGSVGGFRSRQRITSRRGLHEAG
jgi:hypothetical protein